MECKNIIENGSIDLANGCPVCGHKKFQYIRPAKKEARSEKELRKLSVAEYVAQAAASEAKLDEQKHKPVEHPRPSKSLKVELKADVPVAEKVKPAHADKKPHSERIDSVRILEKGNYDLNLPMLLNRKELVMTKEDGVYVVDLPSALKTTIKKKKQ